MNGFLPIYKLGSLKGYQLKGNYQNWKNDLIIGQREKLLPFISDFFDTTNEILTDFIIYKLDENLLSNCKTYDEFINCRKDYIDLPTIQINKQTISVEAKQRYYNDGTTLLSNFLSSGIYEIYFTDTINTFESEIFGICGELQSLNTNIKWDTTFFSFDTELLTFDKF